MPDNGKTPVEIADERLRDLEEKSQGQLEGLSDKISGSFWDRIKSFFMMLFALQWEGGGDTLHQVAFSIVNTLKEDAEPLTSEDIAEKIKVMHSGDFDPDTALKELQSLSDTVPFVGYIFRTIYIIMAAGGLLKADLSAAWEQATQVVYSAQRPSILPPENAVDALWKDETLREAVKSVLNRLGLSDELQEMMLTSSQVPLDVTMLKDAYLRGFIEDNEHDTEIRKHHLSDDNIQLLKRLYEIIPPVQDIITMAVREVFSPEIVQQFGQMEGMPEEFAEWAEKQGLSTYWARAYWASHWRLPSIGQGFEMLQRRVIDDDELDLLLRAADIMPYWRGRLKEISYVPLTRVDVRRMYALGVLNEEDVFNAYLDHGYNQKNAQLMTEFTIAYSSEKERELTKTDILDLYKKHAIDDATGTAMLRNIGYSEDNAILLLYRAASEVYTAEKKKQVAYIEKAFVAGKISESEALNQLGRMDLPSNEINYYIDTWELAKKSKVRNLTMEQIKAFYMAEVITEIEATEELKELGYNTVDTNRFIQLFRKGKSA